MAGRRFQSDETRELDPQRERDARAAFDEAVASEWAMDPQTQQFAKGAIAEMGKRRDALLQQCATTTDPNIARLHGELQQAIVTVQTLQNLGVFPKAGR